MSSANIEQASYWLSIIQSGQASEQQKTEFKQWLVADKQHEQAFRQVYQAQSLTSYSEPMADKLADNLKSKPVPEQSNTKQAVAAAKTVKSNVWRYFSAVAASVLLVIFFWQTQLTPAQPQTMVYQAGKQTETVHLADGTVITLGAGTQLSVSFSKNSRDLILSSGEAYFKVAHDSLRPFNIQNQNALVSVLGTEFEIQNHDKATLVNVQSGRVAVTAQNQRVEITQQQQVVVDSQKQLSPVIQLEQQQIAAWRMQRFDFVNRPIGELIDVLNRYSDSQYKLATPAIAQQKITTSFAISQVEQVLNGLAITHSIQWRKDSQGIIWLTM
ncbi:FecR domain-containing protein [Catenovulum sp. 2E275]|uniref:FecR family protein n=1 Tax=Catenovulum sp. 2E275 TaxID=2980497 RepID=UPI0021CFFA33|nr:FecR domain-containing protein [Catenovulum sp. 2E275]MCU4675029.1 FecR domain-containing protein [Catenovulum sp. 2E275]